MKIVLEQLHPKVFLSKYWSNRYLFLGTYYVDDTYKQANDFSML